MFCCRSSQEFFHVFQFRNGFVFALCITILHIASARSPATAVAVVVVLENCVSLLFASSKMAQRRSSEHVKCKYCVLLTAHTVHS